MRVLRVILITLAVILLLYGVYYLLGRPAIPLPGYRYNVPQGQTLYDLVKGTESDELKLVINTGGEIEASADGKPWAKIDYTPDTLDNAKKIVAGFVPQLTNLPKSTISFFYNILRLRITVIAVAQ